VTGGAAYAQTATASHEHGLEHRPLGDLWQTAGQAQERDRSVLGSAEPIPEPTPTPQPQGAPVGDRRGNAIVTAAALLLALVAQPIRWWLGRRSPGRRPISAAERRHGR
jgi:hypothetical protein